MNVTGEKMVKYYSIYDQLFEDPFILLPDIAQIMKLSEKEVSQLLGEMYSQRILQGPMVFVKPAENAKKGWTDEDSAFGWNAKHDCTPPFYLPFPFDRKKYGLPPCPGCP